MASQADFYPLILPAVAGCPEPTVDLAVTRAAVEFCEQSRVWEVALDSITLSAEDDTYPLPLPDDALLVCVRNVRLDGRSLQPVTDWQTFIGRTAQPGLPTHFAVRGNDLLLYPAPVQSGTVTLSATLKPTFNAATLPDVLLTDHMPSIAEGAKAFLKEMTGTAWFDPAGFALASKRFSDAISKARIDVEHGFAAGSLTIAPRRYGRR